MKLVEAKEVLRRHGYEVEDAEVVKNGKVLNAVTVGTGRIRPNIYEATVEKMESDDQLIEMIERALNDVPDIDVDSLLTRETARNCVMSCVRHETEDDSIVKFPVMGDLEEYFRLQISDEASIVVKREHLDAIGVSEEELQTWGRENLRKEISIQDMASVLAEMMGMDPKMAHDTFEDTGMYVATNARKCNAASVMLLDDVLDQFCEEHSIRHLAIIPSSIHEILLLNGDAMRADNLDELIVSVNEEQVSEDERLSSHAYYHTPA